MARSSTIAELMERRRIMAGAEEYKGHTYMDLARFDENTKHMIIFDVLTHDSPVGWKGERTRLYLSDVGFVLLGYLFKYKSIRGRLGG